MTRLITQILLGLMLFFGTVTIFPKAVYYFRLKHFGKGILYSFLCFLCTLFAVLAFHYAYLILKGI